VGNLFIATGNSIRRVDAVTHIIATVAGSGIQGFFGDGGLATAAQLRLPEGVGVDGAGNLFIADSANDRIRRVDAVTNIITTVAGNGTYGFSVSFRQACMKSAESVGIVDCSLHRGRRIADENQDSIRTRQSIRASAAPFRPLA
jgi:hypothetical protein